MKTIQNMITQNWSELGEDLVMLIEEKIVLYLDKVRFRAVCVPWNCIPPKLPNLQVKNLPWLFFVLPDDNRDASHGLFDPLDKKLYLLDLPDEHRKLFKGPSNGWVVILDDTKPTPSPVIYLVNPLTKLRIELPSRNNFHDMFSFLDDSSEDEDENENTCINAIPMQKIVWSSAPSSDDCVVVANCRSLNRLAYCRRTDEKWTSFFNLPTEDMIFFNGKLHVLIVGCEVLVFDSIFNPTKFKIISSPIQPFTTSCDRYLVESTDGLLMMVEREFRKCSADKVDCSSKTFRCRVYVYDPTNFKWNRVKSIGDDVIFVGRSSSTSVSCRDFPDFKGNRIFFSDKLCNHHLGSEVGMFNLEDETIESLPGFKSDPMKVWPPPVWVATGQYQY